MILIRKSETKFLAFFENAGRDDEYENNGG